VQAWATAGSHETRPEVPFRDGSVFSVSKPEFVTGAGRAAFKDGIRRLQWMGLMGHKGLMGGGFAG
jgi:hypothetical protein